MSTRGPFCESPRPSYAQLMPTRRARISVCEYRLLLVSSLLMTPWRAPCVYRLLHGLGHGLAQWLHLPTHQTALSTGD